MLGVSPNTVTRWAREGRLPCQVTLGGHHRFDRELVEQLRKSLYRAGGRTRLTSASIHGLSESSEPRPRRGRVAPNVPGAGREQRGEAASESRRQED